MQDRPMLITSQHFFSSLPVATCTLLYSYVVLDTAVTKMQILTLLGAMLEACLDLFNHKNA